MLALTPLPIDPILREDLWKPEERRNDDDLVHDAAIDLVVAVIDMVNDAPDGGTGEARAPAARGVEHTTARCQERVDCGVVSARSLPRDQRRRRARAVR